MDLQLPKVFKPRRILATIPEVRGDRIELATLRGPGCIRRIWMGSRQNRQGILRIYWDGEEEPSVESPIGDFFGLCHGVVMYPISSLYLVTSDQDTYTSYFPMPFASEARIEVEVSPKGMDLFWHIEWHEYPEGTLEEPLRFHAQWRREYPCEAFGEDYLVLDAAGEGRLLGFTYGVRVRDDAARWSHGGADNIYIDGEQDPAFLRGSGGEDTFGVGSGGVLHEPDTSLYQGMPYYVHEDLGPARAYHSLAAYRFFETDAVPFSEHLHFRFGSVGNDICSTAYWYQTEPHRPFFRMPPWDQIEPVSISGLTLRTGEPELELRRGTYDLPLETTGSWWLCGPFEDASGQAMSVALEAEKVFDPGATWDGGFEADSPWRQPSTIKPGQHIARWVRRDAIDGFIDFGHVFRPDNKDVAPTWPAAACALAWLESPADTEAVLQLAWDDDLIVKLNDGTVLPRTHHRYFDTRQVTVTLKRGRNRIALKLNNHRSLSWGAWCFAFAARLPDGTILRPSADDGAD